MMKNYKLYKYIDVLLQASLIIGSIIYTLFNHADIFNCYFIVGGYQLLNHFIHFLLFRFRNNSYRRTYNLILLGCIFSVIPPIIFVGAYLLLIVSPFIAVYFTIINYVEAKNETLFL